MVTELCLTFAYWWLLLSKRKAKQRTLPAYYQLVVLVWLISAFLSDFYFNNCVDAVSDALLSVGLDPGWSEVISGVAPLGGRKSKRLDPIPNIRFDHIRENNKKRKKKEKVEKKESGDYDGKPKEYQRWGPIRREFYDNAGF